MNFKSSAVAAAILLASFAASATSYDLGTLDSTSTDQSSDSSVKMAKGAVITDTWTFTIDAASAVSVSAQQTFAASTSAITSFAGTLVGYGALSLMTFNDVQQNLSWSGSLAAGTYTVIITGVSAAKNSLYTAQVSAIPAVPEPETYALMLAGLGAVAFVARRRKSA